MTAFDDASADQLRTEDTAALDAFNACHRLTAREQERAIPSRPFHRPDRIRPLYRYRPGIADTHTVTVIPVRDGDDEPWGDPVGLGMPRGRRPSLAGLLMRALTAKYRRVFA